MADTLRPGLRVKLTRKGEPDFFAEFTKVALYKGGVRAELEGVVGRSGAEAVMGCEVLASRDDLPEPSEGEYYDTDIIGCTVLTVKGRELGPVIEVIPTGANDIYVVPGPEGEILIPAAESAIVELDVAGRRIVVEPSALSYPEPPQTETPKKKSRRRRAVERRAKAKTSSEPGAEPPTEEPGSEPAAAGSAADSSSEPSP